ncbi:MAG: hypothetical protein IJO21_02770 [Oscillospiraceae bacterium]|nr:hypothetical protein [Oscillospiraceae bacterium]
MTGKDLFTGLSYIDRKYIEEAEKGTLKKNAELTIVKQERKARKRPRILLIAAIVALMLLLVGCVAVVFMGLQERTIGSHVADMLPPGQEESVTTQRDVVTLFGYQGTPHYQAMQEWYAFTESYDPDLELMTNTNELGIPDQYWYGYFCYTWEMVEKLEEILDKYGLKPLGVEAVVQNWDTEIFLDAVQLDSLIRKDSGATARNGSGYFYPEGSFKIDLDIMPEGGVPRWTEEIWATIYYTHKDYFDPAYTILDSETYEEWLYTTSYGMDVTIAMREKGAILFGEQENAYMTVSVFLDPYDHRDAAIRADVENFAEIIDFAIQPKVPQNMDDIRQQLADSMARWEAEQQEMRKLGGNYAEYLCNRYKRVNDRIYYAFHDINADGEKELLIGNADGKFTVALTIADGGVVEMFNSDAFRIDGDGIIMNTQFYDFRQEYYYARMEGYDPNGNNIVWSESLSYDSLEEVWMYRTGTGGNGDTQITPAEAQQIMDQYVAMEIPVFPLMEFAVDDAGTTLRDYIEANRVELTAEQRLELYQDYVRREQESAYIPSTHYMLMDVNGDGLEELLLTYDESCIKNIISEENGEIIKLMFWTRVRPCENGIWERFSGGENEDEFHWYFTMDLEGEHRVEYILYWGAENVWYRDSNGDNHMDQVLTESEFETIKASYTPVPMDLKPIGEFSAD